MLSQEVLWCACGCLLVNRYGTCAQCNRRQRLSEENFGGNRDEVIRRDGSCRACGSIDDLLVHHRRPGNNQIRWLITLCRACHTRIHHTCRPPLAFSNELRVLWREANPDLAEQYELELWRGPSLPPTPKHQTLLFEAG